MFTEESNEYLNLWLEITWVNWFLFSRHFLTLYELIFTAKNKTSEHVLFDEFEL